MSGLYITSLSAPAPLFFFYLGLVERLGNSQSFTTSGCNGVGPVPLSSPCPSTLNASGTPGTAVALATALGSGVTLTVRHCFASVIVIVRIVVTVELIKTKLCCVDVTTTVLVAIPFPTSVTVWRTICVAVAVASAGAVIVLVTYIVVAPSPPPPLGGLVGVTTFEDGWEFPGEPHFPNACWHLLPQWSGLLPHQPCSEQQSPNEEPAQVKPGPHCPFLLTSSPPPGEVGGRLGEEEVGTVEKLGSTQYRVPVERALQVVTPGLARRNCETVIPAASEREAHVSPARAVTTMVHTSAAAAAAAANQGREPKTRRRRIARRRMTGLTRAAMPGDI